MMLDAWGRCAGMTWGDGVGGWGGEEGSGWGKKKRILSGISLDHLRVVYSNSYN